MKASRISQEDVPKALAQVVEKVDKSLSSGERGLFC